MIRLATGEDAAAIVEIYRSSIEESVISFETAVPSLETMCQRIESCLKQYPWIVEEDPEGLLGYAYASSYHLRAAYRWSVTVSVYVHRRAQRQGVASRLYRVLFEILEQQRIRKVLAGITMPNLASQQLHESFGFELASVLPQVGYKLGRWLDVSWWQRPLGEGATSAPAEPRAFPEIAADWQGNLARVMSNKKEES